MVHCELSALPNAVYLITQEWENSRSSKRQVGLKGDHTRLYFIGFLNRGNQNCLQSPICRWSLLRQEQIALNQELWYWTATASSQTRMLDRQIEENVPGRCAFWLLEAFKPRNTYTERPTMRSLQNLAWIRTGPKSKLLRMKNAWIDWTFQSLHFTLMQSVSRQVQLWKLFLNSYLDSPKHYLHFIRIYIYLMYWTCVWCIYSFYYLLMYCIIHHLLHLFVPCPSGTCSRVCKQVLCGELSCVSFLHCSQGFLTLPFSVERKRRFPYLHRRMSCKIRLEEVTWTETWGAGRVFGSTNCDIHTSKVNQRWDIISAPAWGFHQAKATWILLQVLPLSLDSWLSNCSYLLSTVPASSFILPFLACSVSCCQVQNDISSHLQLPQVSMDGLHQTLALLLKKRQIKINWSMPFRTSKGGDSESTVACAARMLCPSCCHLNLKQDRKTEIYMKYVALEAHQRKRAHDVSQGQWFWKVWSSRLLSGMAARRLALALWNSSTTAWTVLIWRAFQEDLFILFSQNAFARCEYEWNLEEKNGFCDSCCCSWQANGNRNHSVIHIHILFTYCIMKAAAIGFASDECALNVQSPNLAKDRNLFCPRHRSQ